MQKSVNERITLELLDLRRMRTPFRICFLFTLIVCLSFVLVPQQASAQVQVYDYTINNGAITITAYNGFGGAVTIPDTINGFPVTSIGYSAFFDSTHLTSVTIGNNVTNIIGYAFANCTSLTSVSLPSTLRKIGIYSFSNCIKLTDVAIPDSVNYIGEGAFCDCYALRSASLPNYLTSIQPSLFMNCALTSVTIPSTVTSIGSSAFSGCGSLRNVTFPESINYIGNGAFAFCYSLTNAVIPNYVTFIGNNAFSRCLNLPSVIIPSSVTNIVGIPFRGCLSLKAITVDPLNRFYSNVDGVLFDKSGTLLVEYPNGKAGSYTIPDGVTTIAGRAFQDSASMPSVAIPSSVTNIVGILFGGCLSLKAITVDPLNRFYSSVDGVLFDKSGTLLVEYPDGKAGSYTIPGGVTTIASWAFQYSASMPSVTIPSSVTQIGHTAFELCSSLSTAFFEGNAPNTYGATFGQAPLNISVYYLPGTTGWSNQFDHCMTYPWELPNPVILNIGSSYGSQTNSYGFTISWATNATFVVDASLDLADPNWSPVSTNTLANGFSYFSDPNWTNYPSRFYRVRSQ